jgi:DNA mismatch endonuclease (patch repair protein)
MGRIKAEGNKSTETKLRMLMVRNGIRGWKLQAKNMLAKPDFVFPNRKLAIFVDGCFWHGCPKCGHIPKANRIYWENKINRNINRDSKQRKALRRMGWRVLRLWEHQLSKPDSIFVKLSNVLEH